jgi:predicted lipoprotein with Yx(FWY)xxD motif
MGRALRATAAVAFLPLLMAACGSSTSPSSPPAPSATTAPAATLAPTPTPAAAASAATVQTGSATVSGASTTVLTDGKGMTLYYKTSDTATSVTCTGGCAAAWPPLLLPSGTPTGSSAVTGTLTVFAGANGSQVLYNGHPLYTWSMDSAAGQATGDGVGGFKVATPGLAAG